MVNLTLTSNISGIKPMLPKFDNEGNIIVFDEKKYIF